MHEAILSKLSSKLSADSLSAVSDVLSRGTYHELLHLDIGKDIQVSILRAIYTNDYANIFRTRRAREMMTQLLNKLRTFCSTSYSKELALAFLPTLSKQEILGRQEQVATAVNLLSKTKDLTRVRELIKVVDTTRYSSQKRHNGVVIAIADDKLYNEYKSILGKKFYVTLIESQHDLLAIDHYELIRFLPGQTSDFDHYVESLNQVALFSGTPSLEEVAPEFITDILEEQETQVKAILELQELLGEKFISKNVINPQVGKRVSFLTIEKEIERVCGELDEIIQLAVADAAFTGRDFVDVLNKKEKIIDKLERPVKDEILSRKDELIDKLENMSGEKMYAIFNIDHMGRVEVNREELRNLQRLFEANQSQTLGEQKSKVALEAKELIEKLPVIVEAIHKLDLQLAIGEFVREYELEKPALVKQGVSFVYGKNMNVQEAVPIEYHVGANDRIAVLTGANSGGKTTVLELIGQIQILTQMGLYVPAKEAHVGLIEELYYFSKNKGSMGAGAFETLLKQFADISVDEKKKLILADEIESITEPTVAAQLIAGIITHLNAQPQTSMVLVTHMGKELERLAVQARFDGIEAKGLDKDLNLVVERNPLIGRIARSTPQLIIERLAKKENNDFYNTLQSMVKANN